MANLTEAGWSTEELNAILVISPENCAFRGEGNSNIVVALKKEDRVLRLRKSQVYTEGTISLTGETLQKFQLEADFISHVMKNLLGYRFVQSPILIELTAENVRLINEAVHFKRPIHRLKKNVREVSTLGLLLPDHCTLPSHLRKYGEGPVLSVEIKPKQGFLPESYHLPHDHKLRASVCRFHLAQTYKKSKGEILSMSMYCPLDLFSGCPRRMNNALHELLYHPQNNLRVFKDKELIFSEENRSSLDITLKDFFDKPGIVSREEILCQLVTQILVHCFPTTDRSLTYEPASHSDHGPQSCPSSSACTCPNRVRGQHKLPRGCVLDRILQIQRLGSMDVTAVYPHYLSLKEALQCPNESLSALEYLEDGHPSPSLPKALGFPNQQVYETDLEFTCRKIWEFLVALTARDCSIMLSLQKLSPATRVYPKDSVVQDSNGQTYLFSVAVVDLDPKTVSKLEKVYFDDCNLIRAVC
ncbi:inositol-pentakisphosphate 2-kinase [Ixodes scapularis]|uniref:inositol-pentakisphosphate 2-kinase n=1 Tax=Ixodes scapularis TaxID=6945 RepID=UPI001C382056|nr:inositol-pentakisphosphate 2-kinase [Ixodes scapularis]